MKLTGYFRAREFWKADAAVTAVEFALLSPVFFALSFMMLELGLYELYAASLSYATQNAARQLLIGNVQNSANSAGQPVNITTFINDYVCPSLPPPMNCNNVVVNAQVMTEGNPTGFNAWGALFNASQTWLAPPPLNNSQTNFCIGSGGSVVALEIYYAMPFVSIPMVNTPSATFNGSPVIWISSTAAFKNEPFTTTYSGC